MHTATDRTEFAPPPQRLQPTAVALAVLAHLLLVGALTWGVNWKKDADTPAIDAELWSSVPQQAAPRLVEQPSPPPAPRPKPTPTPPPPPKPAPNSSTR